MTYQRLLSICVLVLFTFIPGGERPMAAAENSATGQEVTTSSGLKYVDQAVGTGEAAVAGKNVSVHYTGWLGAGWKTGKSSIVPSIVANPSRSRSAPGASLKAGTKACRG